MNGDLGRRLARLYSSAVHDVLRDRGLPVGVLPPGIAAVRPGDTVAGPVWCIQGRYQPGQERAATLRAWAALLSAAPSGHVLVCQPGTHEIALMGELSAAALKAKGVLGYVVDGATRDVDELLRLDFPVFARHATPKDIGGCWTAAETGGGIRIGEVAIATGDWLLGDRDGVIVIPQAVAAEAVAETERVAATESAMRKAIRDGMDALAAYDKYGRF